MKALGGGGGGGRYSLLIRNLSTRDIQLYTRGVGRWPQALCWGFGEAKDLLLVLKYDFPVVSPLA